MAASTPRTKRSRESACIASAATATPCRARTARRSRRCCGPRGQARVRRAVRRGRVLRHADRRRRRRRGRRVRLDGARARRRHQREPGRAAQRAARTRGESAGGPRPSRSSPRWATTARRRRRCIPAAYDGVIGVTAVDGKHRVLIEACRGKQVDFAAPGADVSAAARRRPSYYAPVRGTSFAAPLVAGLLARRSRRARCRRSAQRARRSWRRTRERSRHARARRHLRRGRARSARAIAGAGMPIK